MQDQETNKIITEQDLLRELVGHQGWKLARRKIADKILELQDAFQLEERTATAMLQDLRARKKAAKIIWEWLNDIEGSATQAEDNAIIKSNKTHIVTKE